MFSPAIEQVAIEFHTTNQELATFVVTIYLLGLAIGSIFIAPLSERYGRVPIYHGSNIFFIIFTIACAKSTSLAMLTVFRFLAGWAGCTPITIGGSTISDIIPREKRRGIMSVWSLFPFLGPVIGPICGGVLSKSKGWRWVFWVLAILVSFSSNKLIKPNQFRQDLRPLWASSL
jgi:multidrug resistance protein